jgi:hypothetical protein
MTPSETLAEARGISSATPAPPPEVRFPQALLNIGFGFALAVAAACLTLSAWYLFTFLQATNSGVESVLRSALQSSTPTSVIQLSILARTAMARFALLSCGVCVGMGFGFLGFALFLLGIKGEMDVEARHENAQIKAARMAPGVFVMLCATVLIGVCITFRTQYEWGGGGPGKAQPPAASASDSLPKLVPGEVKP